MPVSRGILPDGAPAQLFEYFKQNQGATIARAIEALGMAYSNAYYALATLRDRGLIKRFGRKRPTRWEVVEVVEQPLARAPPAIATVDLFKHSERPVYAYTGTTVEHAGPVKVFGVSGPELGQRSYSHGGNVNSPGAAHPWAWGNYTKGR